MNTEKIKSILRHILSFAGGILIAFGIANEEIIEVLSTNVEVVVGAVLAIISAIQGIRNKDKLATPKPTDGV